MIQINPLKSYIDGGVRAAITTPPSASLVFDLPGKAIWVKGVKLKGTDHTYTFSHDNYITLANTPDSNESEDIKIGVNTSALKSAIDTTYGVVSTTANGLAPKFTSGNKQAATAATTYYFLGWTGTTLKWYQAPFRNIRINSETTDRLGVNSTDPLIISSGNGISVTWDSTNKKIVITNTKPDVNHNTDRTGIKLTTVSGTKKTDSTLILANSATGLNIQGGTNKFLIGDGTNYIEVPITPSFTISNKDATIGTALTTIATIAGVDIKAKIASYSLSNHTHSVKINGSTKTIAASGTVDLGNYLPLSGGTMGGTAWIVWPDSGNWGNNNSGVTFPVIRGGLQWSGQSDYVKLFTEETSNDNLNLVLQFGDDNSNGLSIRNKANTQTSYISAGGVITTGTFKGNLDWSYITNKPSSYTPSAHTHAWNSLTHSSTTANQAILSNGTANEWTLKTLNIANWDAAYNLRHSHANKSVLDGITSGLVTNWNTAYTFVSTITGTDTDKVINKWDEIVNFLAGITEDNKLNTLLNNKLSVYKLADNTNVGAIKNNGIYYSTSDASSDTLVNSPFNNGFTLINMTSLDNGDDLRRSRLAFNAYGEVKISNDRGQANTSETWYNVLTSKNSGINGSTIKLNGTSITVYSSSAADGRYVKKTGDTMSGALTIDTAGFGALIIKRNDDTNGASIQFRGKSNIYGYIGLNNSTKDKQFLRWGSDTSKTYTILDTSSTYVSSGKGVINGTTITQVDNATNSTNSTNATNARKLVNWYSARPTSLNTQFGDGSLRIFYATSSTTEGKPAEDSHILHLAWDNTGGWDAQLAVHTRSGKISTRAQNSGTWQSWKTLAFTTDIPTALKNPYALTISLNGTSQGPYDGSAAKNINITPGSIGAATSGHTHAYLPLSGGTMTGNIKYTGKGTSYIGNGENDAANGVGGALNNLVISSWYGISFTTSCSGQTYTNKNAVSINCRNGYVYANTFVGTFSGNASTATKLTSSAGNAALPIYFSDGKPVACTASQIFSNLSNSGNNISVTVAGQNRTLTVGYANNSNTVDGYHEYSFAHSWRSIGDLYTKFITITRGNEKGFICLHCAVEDNSGIKGADYIVNWSYDATNENKSITIKCLSSYGSNADTSVYAVRKSGTQFDLLFKSQSTGAFYVGFSVISYSSSCTIDNYNIVGYTEKTKPQIEYTSSAMLLITDITGNSTSATKLTSSAGSTTLPIYFSDGKPIACNASSIFSNLSNNGNNLSITVAGQNRLLTIAYASTTSKLISRGNLAAYEEGSTTKGESGVNLYTIYNNGYPVKYGNLLHINGSGAGQLLAEWCGSATLGHLYYRSKRDNSDNGWSAWGKVAFVTDNVATASKWITARKITLSGSITGSVSIDGSGDVTLATTTHHTHNWENIEGKPNTFTPSAHTHSYITISTCSTLNENSNNFSVEYASGSNSVATKPSGVDAFSVMKLRTASGWYGQILMSNSKGIYYRSANGLTSSVNWIKLLDSSNSSISGGGNTWGSSITVNINGTSKTLTIPNNPNTDYRVTQSETTTANYRPLVVGYTNVSTAGSGMTGSVTNQVYLSNKFYVQPSTGNLYATNFVGTLSGNATTATTLQTTRTLWGQSFNGSANVSGNMSGVGQITFSTLTGTNGRALLYQQMADNDYFRIYVGGTASNSGYVEIATADDGNEPIYVRQYTGVFSTIKRTFTLLDGSGNTILPGLATATGFKKNGSTDNYVLLGGGGHKIISDFMLKGNELSTNLTTISKSLTVTQAWMDTGIKNTDLPANGTYIVQVSANNTADSIWSNYWSGIMSWYIGGTNDNEADEIILHRAGHAYHHTIYLRTIMTTSSDGRHLRLQIAADTNLSTAVTYTFKFKRVI